MITLEIIFAVIILLIHLKKRDWPITLFLFLIYSCFLFTVVRFPLSEHLSMDSEIFWAYVQRGQGQILPSLKNSEMPLFHIIFSTFQNILRIDSATSIILIRFAICLSIGISCLKISQYIFKNEERSKRNIYVFLPTFFCLYDWNINYLLLGDQLRNALAIPFLLLQLSSLAQKQYKLAGIYCILAIFSHKLGIIFGLSTILIFFLIKKFQYKFTKYHLFVFLPICTLISIKIFRKIIFMTENNYLMIQVNHNILLGLVDGLFIRKGVILAKIIYISLFVICFKNFKKIKENTLLMVSLVISVILFTASNYGIIMYEKFQEPNRFYFMLASYLPLVAGSSLISYSKRFIFTYILAFFIANFLFKQFARDVLTFFAIQRGNPLHDIVNYTIVNQSYLGSIISILIMTLLLIIFARNNFFKESSHPI